MEIDYKEVGKRMAKRRKELELKQYQVCEMINVNYKYISNLETGRSVPSLEVIMNICEALQVTPDYLLLGTLGDTTLISDKSLTERIGRLSQENKKLILGIIELMEK
ncbi:MAG: helix-turn-helix transcriptional regulator [Oscillospiraceae bacterium]|nr:helix-turn-helix transcriptional regulator [Oscillospiraceae bacterium]